MKNYWMLVNDVIRKSDLLLIILDARVWKESRNIEIEKKINAKGKRFIYVLNKADLMQGEPKIDLDQFLLVSSKEHHGNMKLLRIIGKVCGGKQVTVGVLGYPNVGKSSIINAMKGKNSAPSSSVSGFTKGIQMIRVSRKVMLIDTPGVFPYGEKDEVKQALIGAKDAEKLKDPEMVSMDLITALKGTIEEYYGVESSDDPEEVLERIAIKKKIIKKGGVPDSKAMAKLIIAKWQRGEIQ